MMSTSQATTWTVARQQNRSVISISVPELNPALGEPVKFALGHVYSLAVSHSVLALAKFPKWQDPEYRQAYAEAAVEQGVAWQIRANRKARGWSQEQLADMLATQQSAVSRLEDPTYGKQTLETLTHVAAVFDCAVSVRFVPFSVLAVESLDLSPDAMIVKSFEQELQQREDRHDQISN